MFGRLDGLVFFNPDRLVADRAAAQLAALRGTSAVVIDNSTDPDCQRLVDVAAERWSLTVVRLPGGNVGTAGGLNELIRRAAALDLAWMHYLDQDSILGPEYAARLEEAQTLSEVAVVGATYSHTGQPSHLASDARRFRTARYVISSGSLFSVGACLEVGLFSDALFLDLVDTEMCFRLRRAGHTVIVDGERYMEHTIGESPRLVGRMGVTSHPLWRRRLMWKNSVLLTRLYGRQYPGDILRHWAIRLAETGMTIIRTRRLEILFDSFAGARDGLRTAIVRRPPPS